jgi:hypothetical protein
LGAPNNLSDWTMPPPSAGDSEPVRVFDSLDAVIAFLNHAAAPTDDI